MPTGSSPRPSLSTLQKHLDPSPNNALPLSVPDSLEEANCLLGVAHAARDVCRTAKRLADYQVKETLLRAELYRLHAAKAEQQLRVAEMDVGRARLVVRKGGFRLSTSASPSPPRVRHKHISNNDSTAPSKKAKPTVNPKQKAKSSAKENAPAKKSRSKKETVSKPKTAASTKDDMSSSEPRRSGRLHSTTGGALQIYETTNEAQQTKENERKKANTQPIPESTPINPFAPVKDKPPRRRKKTEDNNNNVNPSGGTSQAPSAVPQYLVPPGTEPRLQPTSNGSRFGLHIGMSPTLERLSSKQFFPSKPPQDSPFQPRPLGLTMTHPPTDQADAASNHGPHAEDDPLTPISWQKRIDPTLLPSQPPQLGSSQPQLRPGPSQPQPGPSQPPPPARVHWGPSTTHILHEETPTYNGGLNKPKQTSERESARGDEPPVRNINKGGNIQNNAARASEDNADGHQIILTHIMQHLCEDRMWRVLGKASSAPISIPDVMKKYRIIQRIIHELNGRVIDNRHTICKSNICEAMEIEESWVDEALDTLRLLELYGENGQRYEDSRVYDLLNDNTAVGQPRIHLLELLKQCDIDWLKGNPTEAPQVHDGAYNVVDAHHLRNRHPSAPKSDRLNAIRNSYTMESSASESDADSDDASEAENELADDDVVMTDTDNSSETNSNAETDSEAETYFDAEAVDTHKHTGKLRNAKGKKGKGGEGKSARAPRNSKRRTQVKFTQLQAYPGQWRSILEDSKKRNRCTATIETGFPGRREGLKQAEDCLVEAMAAHEAENKVVEPGYYPEHKDDMIVLIFEDLSTFRGELKTAARTVVRQQYKFIPPNPAKLTRKQYNAHVKAEIEALLEEGKFLLNGLDEQGRTNNLSNPALEVLCTSFYYGKNGLASVFPEEFEGEVPEKAIALAATALECGLHEWRDGYMKGRPFSAALYSRTYNTIKKLIKKVNADKYHGRKFKTCREEWAKGGSLQQKSDDDDFDDHVGYQVRLD